VNTGLQATDDVLNHGRRGKAALATMPYVYTALHFLVTLPAAPDVWHGIAAARVTKLSTAHSGKDVFLGEWFSILTHFSGFFLTGLCTM
jgi:hypothetical protein